MFPKENKRSSFPTKGRSSTTMDSSDLQMIAHLRDWYRQHDRHVAQLGEEEVYDSDPMLTQQMLKTSRKVLFMLCEMVERNSPYLWVNLLIIKTLDFIANVERRIRSQRRQGFLEPPIDID